MALKIDPKFKFKGVQWKSGHLYKFRYSNWYEDPEPMMILLYRFKGTHPKTKHEWRFIQGINMNYLPRHVRRNFAINWKQTLERNNGNVLLTWNEVKAKFPGIVKSDAIRRYFYKPAYYIQRPEYIPMDKMEEALISSWHKDFSKKMKMALTRKYRQATKKKNQRIDKGITKILKTIFGKKR